MIKWIRELARAFLRLRDSAFIVLAIVLIAALFLYLFRQPLSLHQIQASCEGCSDVDTLAIAASLGRLDFVAIALSFLGIGVGVFAIFGYLHIRQDAEDQLAKHKAELEKMESNLQERLETWVRGQVEEQAEKTVSDVFKQLNDGLDEAIASQHMQGKRGSEVTADDQLGDDSQ